MRRPMWTYRLARRVGSAALQRDIELLNHVNLHLNELGRRVSQLENWQIETDCLLEGK